MKINSHRLSVDKFLVCQKFFGAPHAHLSTDKKLSRDDLGVNPGENIFGAKFSISPYASVLVPDEDEGITA